VNSHDDLSQHPDLAATSATMRAAWREEQEAATRDAAEDWQHRLTLVDRLRAHMHRGDGVTVAVLGRRFVGFVEEVGDDVVALRTASGRIDMHLVPTIAFEYAVTSPAREGGHRGTDAVGGSFRAALLVREQDARVLLGTAADPDGRAGRLRVGADHVVLTTPDTEVAVPLASLGWVCPAPD
jgi:hypothetical protein